jgi:PAS domain S-box-containing protein
MKVRDPEGRRELDKLKIDEGRYRFLLDNTGDILWTIDLDGCWRFMTKNVEKIAHLKLSDILEKTVWDFVAPDYVQPLKEKLKRRLQGEDLPPYEVEIINGNGKRIPFEVVTTPLRNEKGEIVGIQGISRDISGRKCAEDAARKSEEKFKDLVENTYDWVWEADRELVLTYSNPRVRDYLGYTPKEVTGRSLYDFMEPGFAKRIAAKLDNMVKQHKKYDIAEKTLISKSGDPVDFEMTASLMFGEDGTFQGYRGICRDIRDRKRGEEARRKAYGELEKRVKERTAELQEAKRQAELYLDLMSHDINNMDMVAMGKIEMALQLIHEHRDVVELLDGAQDMLRGSSQLIENVRKIQRAEQGRLETGMVDLCDVLEDVKKKYSAMPGMDIAIDIRYEESNGCLVLANRLIEDVFSNLVGNSIKHADPGKPVLIDIRLTIISSGGNRFYQVTIEDNGPGIPDDMKGQLFSRLGKGKTKTSGRGLGLYLVRKLVDDFGGKVWAEDRVRGDFRQGSRFVVQLPAAVATAEPGKGVSQG